MRVRRQAGHFSGCAGTRGVAGPMLRRFEWIRDGVTSATSAVTHRSRTSAYQRDLRQQRSASRRSRECSTACARRGGHQKVSMVLDDTETGAARTARLIRFQPRNGIQRGVCGTQPPFPRWQRGYGSRAYAGQRTAEDEERSNSCARNADAHRRADGRDAKQRDTGRDSNTRMPSSTGRRR